MSMPKKRDPILAAIPEMACELAPPVYKAVFEVVAAEAPDPLVAVATALKDEATEARDEAEAPAVSAAADADAAVDA